MPPAVMQSAAGPGTESHAPVRDRLRRFLQAYWLRPENALWMALRSAALSHFPLHRPSIDLACGDGIFSFLHCGGALAPEFDVFRCVKGLDRAHEKNVDIFDTCDESYRPRVLAEPVEGFDSGADWKPTLLFKASRLGFYGHLIRHDNNRPLPFADAEFATVYCNAAYWVSNIEGFLREARRITRPDGRIILQVKLDAIRRYTLDAYRDWLGTPFLDRIAGRRLESWPSLASRTTWERRFAAAGLEIQETMPVVTRTHAHLWDVGLRPIAPFLIRLANNVSPSCRASVKREWVDLFEEIVAPMCDAEFDLFADADEPPELQYVLTPR